MPSETEDSGVAISLQEAVWTPDLQEVKVVLRVGKLLHLASFPLQLGNLQLQLLDQPLGPLLCRCLLPLDHLHQLPLNCLHGTHQSGKELQALHHVPFGVFLQMRRETRRFRICFKQMFSTLKSYPQRS